MPEARLRCEEISVSESFLINLPGGNADKLKRSDESQRKNECVFYYSKTSPKSKTNQKMTNPLSSMVVLGGLGQVGQLFTGAFAQLGIDVYIVDVLERPAQIPANRYLPV